MSGFFGGLSGHQGAFRSAFLLRVGLSKEGFIATGVIIACLIDFTRLTVYFTKFVSAGVTNNLTYIVSATLAAFAGAYLGNKLLKRITFDALQIIVAIVIIALAILLGMGVL